jgi:hypothetical protein
MKTKMVVISLFFLLIGSVCFAQPRSGNMKPPTIEERIKMVDEKICQPLKLNNTQKVKVLTAFRDFFVELDKSAKPPARPEKSKADALAKIRDDKVKLAIPATQFPKYLELEMKTRPQRPNGNSP